MASLLLAEHVAKTEFTWAEPTPTKMIHVSNDKVSRFLFYVVNVIDILCKRLVEVFVENGNAERSTNGLKMNPHSLLNPPLPTFPYRRHTIYRIVRKRLSVLERKTWISPFFSIPPPPASAENYSLRRFHCFNSFPNPVTHYDVFIATACKMCTSSRTCFLYSFPSSR